MDIRVDRASFFIAAYNLVCMGASFRRVRRLGTWWNPGIRNGIILTRYVATGVQLQVSLMVVLSIFTGDELVTHALRKRCRKQLNRTNFIPLISAQAGLDSFKHAANGHVCFTPNSGHVQQLEMSALGQ